MPSSLTNAARGAGSGPDVIDTINAIDHELVEWILHAHPSTDEEREEMRRVLALRGKMDQALNSLVLVRMKLATGNVEAQSRRLGELSRAMQATTKSVATVKQVLKTVEEVTSIVASVVSAVA